MWLLFWLSEEIYPFWIASLDLSCFVKLKSNVKTATLHLPKSWVVFQKGQRWKMSPFPLEVLSTVPKWSLRGKPKSLGCIQGCWGSCPMPLWRCCRLSWEGCGDWEFSPWRLHTCYQEGKERRSGMLQTVHTLFRHWEWSNGAILEAISRPMENEKVTRNSLCRFFLVNHCPKCLLQWHERISNCSYFGEIWAGRADSEVDEVWLYHPKGRDQPPEVEIAAGYELNP